MTDQNDTDILEIYKSRQNLLKQLSFLGYDTETYEAFGFNEVNTLYSNNQLDMLLENSDNEKVYIKYHIGKTLRQNNIDEFIDDLINIEGTLEKTDKIIIIIKELPNDTINNIVKSIWNNQDIYISVRSIKTLQFNIFEHNYVPTHVILNTEEQNTFKKQYNILNNDAIPEISRFDPVALALLMKPDEICKIVRSSKTSITSNFYRICI